MTQKRQNINKLEIDYSPFKKTAWDRFGPVQKFPLLKEIAEMEKMLSHKSLDNQWIFL